MHRLRTIMFCGSLACVLETFLEILVGIKQSAVSIVFTAVNLALILTFYRKDLKDLIDKIMGNDDDDFRGGGSFG